MARRWRSLISAIRAASVRARPAARSVGSPRTTSRKWVDRRRSSCQRSRVRCSVYSPISHMNTGTSGSVSNMISADSRSIGSDPEQHRDRHEAGEHDLGQVAGEIGLERLDALDRRRGDLARLGAVEGCRLRAKPPLREGKAQLGEGRRRAAPAGDLEAPGERPAPREDDPEQRRCQRRRRRARRRGTRARRSERAASRPPARAARWRARSRRRRRAGRAPSGHGEAGAGRERARDSAGRRPFRRGCATPTRSRSTWYVHAW